MKLPLFLLFGICYYGVFAQPCANHALMKKGAQLEYHVYFPKMEQAGGATTYYKASRILFEVAATKDSAASTWSTIIKKGIGLNDERDHCERTLILQCDGRNLLFPFDLYLPDTVYLSDINSKYKDKGFFSAATPMVDAISYIFPLSLEGVNQLPEGKKQLELKTVVRSFSDEQTIYQSDYRSSIVIKNITVAGKETITTPAGSFVCYKIYVDSDQKMNKFATMSNRGTIYYNTELGVIKFEAPSGYAELVSVKK
jgi:hypothetical protein